MHHKFTIEPAGASLYALLDHHARAWWWHRRLRESGQRRHARACERRAIREDITHLREARAVDSYALLSPGGHILFIGSSRMVSGYRPGSVLRQCEIAGIAAVDTRDLDEGARISAVFRAPLLADSPETADPEPKRGYHGGSRAPLDRILDHYHGHGATVYRFDLGEASPRLGVFGAGMAGNTERKA